MRTPLQGSRVVGLTLSKFESTQSCSPVVMIEPQNSHSPALVTLQGAPQLGQDTVEWLLVAGFVKTPVLRIKVKR